MDTPKVIKYSAKVQNCPLTESLSHLGDDLGSLHPLEANVIAIRELVALKTVSWTMSLAFMGVACLINVSRCGRIHCRFTGPFLLLCAVASLGYGLGLLPLGASGWKSIGAITIIGAIVLTCSLEVVLGRDRQNRPDAT